MADKYSPIKDTNGKDFSPKFFETEGKMGRFQKAIHWITSYLEMALTILLIVGILASFIHIPDLLGNILSLEENGATGGLLNPHNQFCQCGFSSTVGSGDYHELPVIYLQIQVSDNLLCPLFRGDVEDEIFYF